MRRFRPLWVAKVLSLVAAAIALAGFGVMLLWNWLMPPLTGWHSVTFVQAVGLLVLCRILFGGLRGRGFAGGFRRMSPEERERFRQEMRARCGRVGGAGGARGEGGETGPGGETGAAAPQP